MPSTIACTEQAFAQESGELFLEQPHLIRILLPAETYPADAAAAAAVSAMCADRPEPMPPLFQTEQAA